MRYLLKNILIIVLLGCCHVAIAQVQPTVKWTFDTKDASYGQSTAADIDGDGKMEVVFGCYRHDSCVYALNAEDGSLLWKYNTHATFGHGCNDVAPIIYDVDRDGSPEVIVPSSCNPKTYCFDGKTGAVKWICNTRGSDSPPTIADLDGDGKPELLHGEFGGYVICINLQNGSVNWEIAVDTLSWIQTAPSILDIDNDGKPDFVVATWNASNRGDNKVYAFNGQTQAQIWSFPLNNVVYHGSAIGDLDDDGQMEIVIGCYNDTLYCLNASDGTPKWKYTAGNNFYVGGPALIADVNNDGKCDVVFTAWYAVVALNGDGTLLWRYDISNYGQSFRGAAIADITNDAYPDVIFGTLDGRLMALNGNDGSLIFSKDYRSLYGNSLFEFDNAPLVADFDQDGSLDVFIVGGYGISYPTITGNFGRAYMLDIGPGHGPDWLMFQNDILRNSNICPSSSTDVTQGLAEKNRFSIYPNPINGRSIEVDLQLMKRTDVRLILTNLLGVQVAVMEQGTLAEGHHQIRWDCPATLASGIYYCTLVTQSEKTSLKVVMQ